MTAPVLGLIALWIRHHDGGPALFRQQRIGHHGVPFTMVKLRTMHPGAHARLSELAAFNDVSGPAFRMPDDPRVTGPGRLLRRTGLDELPQLLNIVWGEMSLVGPRPPLPEEVARYAPWQHRRLSVPPGLTGLWQVRGRHLKQVDAWIAMDLSYIDRWSNARDLWLMLLTPLAVFRGWEQDP
jgi:lipopolysaccharide/colanic/teichoic acid biosynthesis glycosyltransferase